MAKETALELGYEQVVFLDDAAVGEDVVGRCCDYILHHEEYPVAVAAFGNNKTRLYWTDKLLAAGYQVPALVHPSAVVSPMAASPLCRGAGAAAHCWGQGATPIGGLRAAAIIGSRTKCLGGLRAAAPSGQGDVYKRQEQTMLPV